MATLLCFLAKTVEPPGQYMLVLMSKYHYQVISLLLPDSMLHSYIPNLAPLEETGCEACLARLLKLSSNPSNT